MYKPALRLVRKIWLSKAFAESNATFAQVLNILIERESNCKFKVVDFEEFKELYTRLKPKNRLRELLGLATQAELEGGFEGDVAGCIFSQSEFLKKLLAIDPELSRMGVG